MEIDPENFAKVTYLTKEGYFTQAYIDVETGKGESKHTGIEVEVAWDPTRETWVQTDDFEWVWTDSHGFLRKEVFEEMAKVKRDAAQPKGQRWQPKRKNRSK